MPIPATSADFLEVVRKSGQIDEVLLENYLQQPRSEPLPQQPRRLARQMVLDGLLTRFQAEQFLLGKHRGFSLAGYRILERLGAGGMAVVYVAEHELMRRLVAIKVVPSTGPERQAAIQRFCREARAAAVLSHPNIVRVYDFRQEGNSYFLVMEYVDGPDLEQLLAKHGPLPIPLACDYMLQTALALQHVHDQGLIHRDVKPSNLLVDAVGTVKLFDLGLALFRSDNERDGREGIVGTADYIAPEQVVDSHTVDARADIYSLGATLYTLLTGETPFGSGTVQQKLLWHQIRQPASLRDKRPDAPQELDELLFYLMAKKPDHRPSNCAEVAALLAPFTVELSEKVGCMV